MYELSSFAPTGLKVYSIGNNQGSKRGGNQSKRILDMGEEVKTIMTGFLYRETYSICNVSKRTPSNPRQCKAGLFKI